MILLGSKGLVIIYDCGRVQMTHLLLGRTLQEFSVSHFWTQSLSPVRKVLTRTACSVVSFWKTFLIRCTTSTSLEFCSREKELCNCNLFAHLQNHMNHTICSSPWKSTCFRCPRFLQAWLQVDKQMTCTFMGQWSSSFTGPIDQSLLFEHLTTFPANWFNTNYCTKRVTKVLDLWPRFLTFFLFCHSIMISNDQNLWSHP